METKLKVIDRNNHSGTMARREPMAAQPALLKALSNPLELLFLQMLPTCLSHGEPGQQLS